MSFPEELTLSNNGATVTSVLSTISVKDSETVRRDALAGLSLPTILRIGTQVSGSGEKQMNRHIVRLDKTFSYDADDPIKKVTRSIYINVLEPAIAPSAVEVVAMVQQLSNFLTEANIVKLLNGES